MNERHVGKLVHVPSDTTLKKFQNGAVIKFCVTKEPTSVLVVENHLQDKVGVYYNGEKWYVAERDIYDIKFDQIN